MFVAITAILTALYEASKQVDLGESASSWLLLDPGRPEVRAHVGLERLVEQVDLEAGGRLQLYRGERAGAYRLVLTEGTDPEILMGFLLLVDPSRKSVDLVQAQFVGDLIEDGPFEPGDRDGTYQGMIEQALPRLLQVAFPGLEPRASLQVQRDLDLLQEAVEVGAPLRLVEEVALDDEAWASGFGEGEDGLSIQEIFAELDDAAVVDGLGLSRVRSLLRRPAFRWAEEEEPIQLIARRLYGDLEALGGDGDEMPRRLLELTTSRQDLEGFFEDHPWVTEDRAFRATLTYLVQSLAQLESSVGPPGPSPEVRVAAREALGGQWLGLYLGADDDTSEIYLTLEGDDFLPSIALKHQVSTAFLTDTVTWLLIARVFNTLYREAWASRFAEGLGVFEDLGALR